jgi:hypothetical protein
MTSDERRAALAQWLANRGFDLTTVDPRRDFGVDGFFEGEGSVLPTVGADTR